MISKLLQISSKLLVIKTIKHIKDHNAVGVRLRDSKLKQMVYASHSIRKTMRSLEIWERIMLLEIIKRA